MKKKYKCPWCQFPFDKSDLTPSPDQQYTYRCPNPAEKANHLPVCQKALPINYLNSKSITIALAGDKYSGKTYYQMALLYELRFNKALLKLQISGIPVADDAILKRIENNINQISRGELLDGTTFVDEPFLIQLKVRNNDHLDTVYFSFYDNPGGWFNDPASVISKMPNVLNADGIIFLIDPIEITHLWENLVNDNPYLAKRRPRGMLKPINTLTEVLRHVKSFDEENELDAGDPWLSRVFEEMLGKAGLSNKTEIDIPVAFTLSKFDQLRNLVAEQVPYDSVDMEIMCIDSTTGKYDDKAQRDISGTIKELLFPFDGSNSDSKMAVDQYYKFADFFGCKSVKVNEKTGTPEKLEPQGVLLPLIWILSKMGIYR